MTYKGVPVGFYRADIVVANKVLVEVKANASLTDADERQVLNYLKATRLEVGLLLNFGPKPSLPAHDLFLPRQGIRFIRFVRVIRVSRRLPHRSYSTRQNA